MIDSVSLTQDFVDQFNKNLEPIKRDIGASHQKDADATEKQVTFTDVLASLPFVRV